MKVPASDTSTPVSIHSGPELIKLLDRGRTFFYCLILTFLLLFISSRNASAQNPCGASTPVFNVNLSAAVNASWTSPMVQRADTCCGATSPDICIEFVVTLNPNSTGIIFSITAGAVPPGALFYQVGCGPIVPVGTPLCLSGVGPHIITFCKPGNNSNEYSISAVPNVSVSNNITLNNGCSGDIGVTGMQEPTVTWTSVFPGPTGTYDSYLSCTSGCDTVTVTPGANAPPYVDYCVCGITIDGCSTTPYCDTVRVYCNPALVTTITPVNPVLCFGNPGLNLTANTTGGTSPYLYQWSTGATTSSIFAGPGTYSVTVWDQSNCPPSTASVTVTTFTAAITANAGSNAMVCASSPSVQLNGSVTGVTTGIWSGGNGTFSPNDSTLNATYTPSAVEIANGSATLILTTTHNGPCPPSSDTMVITINSFDAVIDPGASNVTCNGFNNGQASVNISGGTAPFTYQWSTNPIQTTQVAINLGPGTYTCVVTDANGCSGSATVQITQPPPMALNASGFATTCFNTCNGQAVVIPSGGSGTYSYLWQPSGITSAAATGLCPGTYTVTVTDINGCSLSDTVFVNQPTPVLISTSSTNSYCNHATGSVNVNASGGTGSYTYLWQPVNQSTASVSNLMPGNYSVTVTDGNGCATSAIETVQNTPGVIASIQSVTPALCNASCDGSATATANGGQGPYQYYWNSAPSQTTATATNLCAGSYTLVVTDAGACTDTMTVQITEPAPVSLVANPASPLCIGQGTTLTALASGGTPTYSYSWSPSGPNVSPTTTTTYTVVATDSHNCTSLPQQVTVQVYPALSVNVTGTTMVCMNTGCTLTANGSGGNGGPYTYNWQPGNFNGPVLNATMTSSTTYTVTVSDNCTSPNATATVTVTVPALPVASFTVNDPSACGVLCADFTNTSPNYQSSEWLFSDGFTTTLDSPSHCFSPGTFSGTLIITDANGCRDTVTTPGIVTVYPNPIADFTPSPSSTSILEPEICFTDHSSSDVTTWYWNFDDPNDLTTSTDQNCCHAYSDTGTYCASLIVTNANSCFSTVSYCVMIEPYFALYVPNAFTPNADGLNDLFLPVGDDVDPDHFEMWIYDRWGNMIFHTTTWGEGWDGTVRQSSKLAQIDTYVWKINLHDRMGQAHKMIGKVSIIK